MNSPETAIIHVKVFHLENRFCFGLNNLRFSSQIQVDARKGFLR
ncbi:hypothetical protein [Candidatus Poriferisocius sp.]